MNVSCNVPPTGLFDDNDNVIRTTRCSSATAIDISSLRISYFLSADCASRVL